MANLLRYAKRMLPLACLVFAVFLLPCEAGADDIRYDGSFVLAPNGDLAVTLKFTLPMLQYQNLRDNVSNLYLLLRQLSSDRADTEVVDKKADWDDANRTITFSMTMLGAARNLGKHWEFDVPEGADFSNLDEAKRTLYFNENQAGPMGAIRGTSRLVLPDDVQEFGWEEPRRVARYAMPAPSTGTPTLALWIAAVVMIVLGAGAMAASFVVKPAGVPGGPPSESRQA